MRNEIVLDLETKSAPANFGGRRELAGLGVSVVGVWTSADDAFRPYREADIPKLAPLLREADRVIGFFITKFDFPVLQPYLDFDLGEVPVLDIFDDVATKLGHRISLSSLAKATLGQDKSGHGLDAVTWYREGNWERLEEYCLHDVRLTRDLYRYGSKFGHLLFESFVDQKTVSVPVSWGMPAEAEIRGVVERAASERRALEIAYVSRENSGNGFLKNRKIEIQQVRGEEIEAYDHLAGEIRNFRVGRIFSARLLDEAVKPRPVPQTLFSSL